MPLNLKLIRYSTLNPRQRENYNYQKLSAVLADYGFVTMRLSDDWNGADMIAQHINGDTFLKIQLKGRLTFCMKYEGKDIHVAFRRGKDWYLYPHDEISKLIDAATKFRNTSAWMQDREYSFAKLTKPLLQILNPYQIEHSRNQQPKLKSFDADASNSGMHPTADTQDFEFQ
jgi:hypothetical protein